MKDAPPLTLKDVELATFEDTWSLLRAKLAALFEKHRALLDAGALSEGEAQRYRHVLAGAADVAGYANALLDLSTYLHRAHGEKVVIPIDEHDAPIHAGRAGGYTPQILERAQQEGRHLEEHARRRILARRRGAFFLGPD